MNGCFKILYNKLREDLTQYPKYITISCPNNKAIQTYDTIELFHESGEVGTTTT